MPHCAGAFAKPFGDVFLLQSGPVQLDQPSSLAPAEPLMSYPLTCLSNQAQHFALGETMPSAKLGGGRPRHVLSHQSLNHLVPQPLADPTVGGDDPGAELAVPAAQPSGTSGARGSIPLGRADRI